MRTLRYQQVTLGFCVDLTAPSSKVIPIASVVIGVADGRHVAGVAVLVPEDLDPLTTAMLGDLHYVVSQRVNEACSRPHASLSDVLANIHRLLRNGSVHVHAIGEPATLEVAELGGGVANLLHQGLAAALAGAGRPSTALPLFLVWGPPVPAVAT